MNLIKNGISKYINNCNNVFALILQVLYIYEHIIFKFLHNEYKNTYCFNKANILFPTKDTESFLLDKEMKKVRSFINIIHKILPYK